MTRQQISQIWATGTTPATLLLRGEECCLLIECAFVVFISLVKAMRVPKWEGSTIYMQNIAKSYKSGVCVVFVAVWNPETGACGVSCPKCPFGATQMGREFPI
jgi:hypothetical protein